MPELRPVAAADLPRLLTLNNAAVPHVNALDEASFADLLAEAAFVRVVQEGEAIVGFVVCFAPGAAYASLNYRWFDGRYDAFFYVDRIVVDTAAHSVGLGRRLYAAVAEEAALRGAPLIACEVNELPPNPRSMKFHEKQGFVPIGRRESEDGAKAVVMLTRALA